MTLAGTEVLLESYGVPADLYTGTVADLGRYLEAGHDVMVFVDSSEIWYGSDDDATAGDRGTDHFLLVTGIDLENGVAYLSDPGNPAGGGPVVSLSVPEDAWADGVPPNQMLVTSAPAPGGAVGEPWAASLADPTAPGEVPDAFTADAPPGTVATTSEGFVVLPIVLGEAVVDARVWR